VSGQPEATEPRSVAIREAAAVVALGLAAIWVIGKQTTRGPVLGLPPAFLPMVCAIAIITLGLFGLALRLWKPESLQPQRTAPLWPAAMILGVVIAGVLALQLVGPFVSGVVMVALGLAVLGERRARILIGTMAFAVLTFGAVFQVWR
jgi:hypothetical protein